MSKKLVQRWFLSLPFLICVFSVLVFVALFFTVTIPKTRSVQITLVWAPSSEPDLSCYRIYGTTTAGLADVAGIVCGAEIGWRMRARRIRPMPWRRTNRQFTLSSLVFNRLANRHRVANFLLVVVFRPHGQRVADPSVFGKSRIDVPEHRRVHRPAVMRLRQWLQRAQKR